MPTRPTVPPDDAPFTPASVARTFHAVIDSTANQNSISGGGAIVSRGGTNTVVPIGAAIGLFELTENFNNDDLPDDAKYPYQPAAYWWHAKATRLEYYGNADDPDWDTPDGASDDTTVPETGYVWAPAGFQVDSDDPDRDLPDTMQSDKTFVASACSGMFILCWYDDRADAWVLIETFAKQVTGRLTEDLYQCDSATAKLETFDSKGKQQFIVPFTVWDSIGTVANQIMQEFDGDGTPYIPAGTCFAADFHADRGKGKGTNPDDDDQSRGGRWVVKQFGECCLEGSGSEGSEGSEPGSEGSGGSDHGSGGSGECVHLPNWLTSMPGYDAGKTQVFGHDHGCGKWFDVEPCSSGSGS